MSDRTAFEQAVAESIVYHLDGEGLLIDGEDWLTDAPTGDTTTDQLILCYPSGVGTTRVRITVEVLADLAGGEGQ